MVTYTNVNKKTAIENEADKELIHNINSLLFKLGQVSLSDNEVNLILANRCNFLGEGMCLALYAVAYVIAMRIPKCNFYIRNRLKDMANCEGCDIDFDKIFNKNRPKSNYCRLIY